MRIKSDELLNKLINAGVTTIITVNKDLSLNKPKKINEISAKEFGYMGFGFIKKDNEIKITYWINIKNNEYEFKEDFKITSGDYYLHHELAHLYGGGDKLLKEVI
jgi:hypothetical protein